MSIEICLRAFFRSAEKSDKACNRFPRFFCLMSLFAALKGGGYSRGGRHHWFTFWCEKEGEEEGREELWFSPPYKK